MESLTPNIFVKDMEATISFYQKLGFTKIMSVPEQAPYDWVMMSCGSVMVMFQTFSNLGAALPEVTRANGGSLLFYIKIKGIRDFLKQIGESAKVISPLNKTFYGATEFSILDNNGYVLTFAEDEP